MHASISPPKMIRNTKASITPSANHFIFLNSRASIRELRFWRYCRRATGFQHLMRSAAKIVTRPKPIVLRGKFSMLKKLNSLTSSVFARMVSLFRLPAFREQAVFSVLLVATKK